ncbi:MAG: hypothetical protein GKR89_33510 [Candidatus Latescibacteria bacterium]|nr:hypothetical protein [Candidatus Latescibacterota bacterium]
MINEYLQQGYMVFRGIIPPSLLRDMRGQADIARQLAHQLNGPQAQRIQPLDKYGDRIDLQPFRDYIELAPLRQAVEKLLGPGYTHGHLHIMGLLVEPAERPWHIGWHRDGVVEVPPEGRNEEIRQALDELWYDLRTFNQVNCALYADSCTWFVPGSHLRSFDLPQERQSTGDAQLRQPPEGLSDTEAECLYLKHCQDMPGAIPVHLDAGDFMIYRNQGWHTGIYLPYRRRATIHDIVSHPESGAVTARWRKAQQAARKALEESQAAS